MNSRRRAQQWTLALAAALLAGVCAWVWADAPRLTAEPDRYSLTDEDVVTVDVILESDVTDAAPALEFDPGPNFELTSRAQSTQFTASRWGVVSRSQWQLVLHPLKSGELELPAVRVRLKGRILTAHPGRVQVTASPGGAGLKATPAPSGPGEKPFSGAPEFAIVCEPDRREVFVGEPLLLTVWYYMRVQVLGQDLPGAEPPRASGFVVVELPHSRRETTVVGGLEYERFARRWALTPTDPGEQVIRSAPERLRLDIGGEREYVSNPVRIRVKPRPEPPAGRTFSGLVGNFVVQLAASTSQVRAGEPLTVKLVVDGIGGLATFQPPSLQVPPGTTVRQGEMKVITQPRLQGDKLAVGGRAEVEYALVPRIAGKLEIPPVELLAFDPHAGQYQLLRTAPVDIDVAPGEAIQPATEEPESDLRHIHSQDMRLYAPPPLWAQGWFWVLALVPLAAVGWATREHLRIRRAAANPALQRARTAADVARRAFAAVRMEGGGEGAERLEAALLAYLSDRFGIGGSQATTEAIPAELVARGVTPATAQDVAHLLRRLQHARYAPAPVRQGSGSELGGEALRVLDAVEREAPRP
jgi:hypothetical protein